MLSLIAVHNKPRSVLIVSNDFRIWPVNRAPKFAKVVATALIQIVSASGAIMEARAADANYELKPISLPGAKIGRASCRERVLTDV